jgi:glutaredoxin 3
MIDDARRAVLLNFDRSHVSGNTMANAGRNTNEPIRRQLIMNKIRMYATALCPYCVMAERLLRARGVTEIEKLRIDLDPTLRDQMMADTGRRTVPQIYIGDLHVGGFDDLARWDREGRLTPLLTGSSDD